MESLTPQREFISRLLADAEAEAAAGRAAHALILLRWASRISPEPLVPLVLLTHHRIRGSLRAPRAGPAGETGSPPPEFGAAENPDVFGFPRPRFPTRAPALDEVAFIPAPARPHLVGPTRLDEGGGGAPVRMPRLGLVLVLAGGLAAATMALIPGSFTRGGAGDQHDLAGEQLRAGRPDLALATTGSLPQRLPRTHLIRAEAYLLLGDSAAAAASLDSAASHPGATVGQLRAAAQSLSMLDRRDAAADAATRALAAGLPRAEWTTVAEMLDRAGRRDQAQRLRQLTAQKVAGDQGSSD